MPTFPSSIAESTQTSNRIPLWRQLQATAAVLMAVRNDGVSLTAALQDGTVDAVLRPGVQALSFHTLRWLGRAEAVRQQLASRPPPPEADALLCTVLALALGNHKETATQEVQQDHVPAYTSHTLVDQAVEAAKRSEATRHQASFINGCLRRFLREQEALTARACQNPEAVWNHPAWWISQLRKDYPADWQAILRVNNAQAPLVLRINERKTTRSQYLSALAAINLGAYPVLESGLVLAQARPVTALPGFAEGHFSVQDAAGQRAAPLLLHALRPLPPGIKPKILDACAAPGGKAAHILERIDCDLVALDIDARRCERMAGNLQRLGLHADIRIGDASRPGRWRQPGEMFDGILLDAPCTASGIVRRHPDVRWLRRANDIAQLVEIQKRLLESLWPLLKPGGSMLYATCSVFLAEGEQQAAAFAARHADAVRREAPGHLLPQHGSGGAPMLGNNGDEHDGFFYALFEKRSQ